MQAVVGWIAAKHRERGGLEPRRDDEGFTLIELLVVVVIIGILVAIAIPLYLNYRSGAENKSSQSDLRNAVGAIEACIADNGGKVPGLASGTAGSIYVYSASLYFSCQSDGSGIASSTAPSGGAGQTVNISPGGGFTYYTNQASGFYVLATLYNASSGRTQYKYDSRTAKITTVP